MHPHVAAPQPQTLSSAPPADIEEVTPADIPGGLGEHPIVLRIKHLLRVARDSAAYHWLTETRPGMFVLGAAAGLFLATILFALFSGGDPKPAAAPVCPAETEESSSGDSDESSGAAKEVETPQAKPAITGVATKDPPAAEDTPAAKDTPATKEAPPAVATTTPPPATDEPVFVDQPLVPTKEARPEKKPETKPTPRRKPRRKVRSSAAARKKKLARRYVSAAKKALRARRYRTASRLAIKALRLQPGNRQATRIRARVRDRNKKRR